MDDRAASRARWDERYDRADYLFGTDPATFLRRQAERLNPGSRVLAVADGEGRNSVYLAKLGHGVVAFDPSAPALAKAERLARAVGVSVDFRQGDVETWDWDTATYDAVAAIYIQFAGPALRGRVFAGLDRGLAPGGLLLLHGFAPRQVSYGTGGPPDVENMYTLEMLRAAFLGYDVLHEADYDEMVDAGEGHNGLAALIDFVARKSKEG